MTLQINNFEKANSIYSARILRITGTRNRIFKKDKNLKNQSAKITASGFIK